MAKVLILDTSILCVWLKIPGKETFGSGLNCWDFERVHSKIEEELAAKTTMVLPLASIIETGNHIAQCSGDRYALAMKFADLIRKTANKESPWAAFNVQSRLWNDEKLNELADNWPELAAKKLSLGDATIKDVAAHYMELGYVVEIFTGDELLKSYENKIQQTEPSYKPRRKR